VVNEITSRFRFRGSLIAQHVDDCDPRAWARQAFGDAAGWLSGRIRLVRAFAANLKLNRFLRAHPAARAI